METFIPKTRTVLKKWVRIVLFSLILLIFFAGLGVIYKGFELKRKNNMNESIYDYHITQGLDYKIHLNKNSFIEENYLGKNETYIADLIKNMELTFLYNFSGVKSIPLQYTYQINAVIKGEYTVQTGEEKSKVWSKEVVLVEPTKVEVEQNQFTIKEIIDLDYNTYNDEVQQFRKELNLPITANLNIEMKIDVIGQLENELQDTKTISLQIPLNEQAFHITEDYEEEFNGQVLSKTEYQGEINNKNLICGILLIISAIFLFVIFFKEIFNIQKKNNYTIQLNRILKSYGDIIIELATPLNINGYHIIDVKNFNEMIDLEEELRIPINFYETIDFLEGEFYILQGDIVYRYRLTNETQKN